MFVSRTVFLSRLLSQWKKKIRCPTSALASSSSSSSTKEDARRMRPAASAAAVTDAVRSTPDFYNTRVIYGARSSWQILRSYVVFSLCSVDFIVDRQTKILWWMRRLLGRRLFVQLMKKTVFGQFMSSDDPDVILDLARTHSKSGVSPLFAYTAAEFHATPTGESRADSAQNRSARDAWCQRNFDAVLRGIDIAAKCKEFTSDQPVVTTKITFLTDYDVLRRLTDAVNQQTQLIESAMIDSRRQVTDRPPSRHHRELIEYLTKDVFQGRPHDVDLSQLAPPSQATTTTNRVSSGSLEAAGDDQISGLLTNVRFHLAFNESLHEATSSFPAKPQIVRDGMSSVMKLSREDVDRILSVWSSMTELNQRASEHDVIINYDAEQTFIQPGIEALVIDSMRLFNRVQPRVLNTYQCYLKRTFDVLRRDLEMCDLEGFCFGGKMVRGAYMDEERRLARQTNSPDPVNESYDATTDLYSRSLDRLLSRSVDRQTPQPPLRPPHQQRIIVATHNVDTVNFVIKRLAERKLDARKIGISFAQLLGTRDYISFALGAAGYPAGKLIHYADPEDGLAYLSRRLQENRSGLPSPALERRLLQRELKRRILGR